MLTSFFKKSNPANLIVLFLVLSLFYLVYNFITIPETIDWVYGIEKLGVFLLLFLQVYILNYILLKEKSEGRNAYVTFLFLFFSIAYALTLTDNASICSGFFVVLGMHRVFSLSTGKSISKKIFDAFFCFSVASLFFPTALFLMIIPLYGIFYYAREDYRHWLIPLPAIASVFILKTLYSLLIYDKFFNPTPSFSFQLNDFGSFQNPVLSIPLGIILLFTIWSLFFVLTNKVKAIQARRKADLLLLVGFVASIPVILFSGIHDKNEFALLLPIIIYALIGGRHLEISEKSRLKEIILVILVLACISTGILSKWHLI